MRRRPSAAPVSTVPLQPFAAQAAAAAAAAMISQAGSSTGQGPGPPPAPALSPPPGGVPSARSMAVRQASRWPGKLDQVRIRAVQRQYQACI